jgi:hypothetical protein
LDEVVALILDLLVAEVVQLLLVHHLAAQELLDQLDAAPTQTMKKRVISRWEAK